MFKIFYDTLVRPKEIVNHVDSKSKGKFIGFIIILILLMIIPYFIAQIDGYSFTGQEAENIASYILGEKPLEYEIKDGSLIYTGSGDANVRNVRVEKDEISLITLPIYLVFSLDGSGYEVNEENAYIAIFKEKEIEIIYRPYKKVDGATKLSEIDYYGMMYPEEETSLTKLSYENINVNLNYTSGYKDEYYLNIYTVGSMMYNQIKWDLILDNALFTIIMNVVSFFMSIIITVIMASFLFRFMGLKFKTIFKIATLCSTIYVVGYLLGYLYNFQLISLIGEFLSIVYTYRVMKQYAIIKMTNHNGGN